MEGEKEADNSTEALEMGPKSDSSGSWVKQDELRCKDVNLPHLSSKSSPKDASPCSEEGNIDSERVAHQAANHGYYLSYDGTRSKLEDPSFISSQAGSEVPCSARHLGSSVRPVGVTNRYHHMARISSLPKQEQDGLQRSCLLRSWSASQPVSNHDRSKINESYNQHRNVRESGELVRGPRSSRTRDFSSLSSEKICSNFLIRREQFNKSDFLIRYRQAKFFMIKSYSEDDIHKSIKYNVWASTPYGNMKLDAAFKDADTVMKENGTKCPIFLFFSVNASGQFVGLAEMTGPVDFRKSMDFWQQDKWNGFFPVTWHVVKDIPNRQFQNITLENNDNRAVTFSRDTQEIGLPQGLRMLFIFKGFPMGTSMLDDFEFYESREKSLRSLRRSRPASRQSELEYNDQSCSLNQLEAAFRKVSVSSSPSNPPDRRSSVFDHSSNSSFNYR